MAQFPCDRHGGRYIGAQRTLYVSVYDGEDTFKRRYRLCRDCLADVCELVTPRTVSLEGPLDETAIICLACGEADPMCYVVVTYYDEDSPVKRAGGVCLGCSDRVPKVLGMPPGSGQARD